MKKLLIMFAMLLGSVATMQAQTFNFICLTDDFSSTETTLLTDNGFTPVGSGTNYQTPVVDGNGNVIITPDGSGMFFITDDLSNDEHGPFSSLAAAIEAANSLATGMSSVEGFTIEQLQDFTDSGFEANEQGVLVLVINAETIEARDVTISYSSEATRVQRDDQEDPEYFHYALTGVRGPTRYTNNVNEFFALALSVRDFTSEQLVEAREIGFINVNNHPDWVQKQRGAWVSGSPTNKVNLQSNANGFVVWDNDGEIIPTYFSRTEFTIALTFADNATVIAE